jgi:hypothetical protein
MGRRSLAVLTALLALALVAPAASAGGSPARPTGGQQWSLAKRIALFKQYGRVITPGYLHQKALADAAWARSHHPGGSAAPRSIAKPKIIESFDGPDDPTLTPPDSMGAVGPTRYINMINTEYQIFDRTVSPPVSLSAGKLADIAQVGQTQLLFDPYIIWDAGTKRFYYSMGNIVTNSPENYEIAWGYSKTASPRDAGDWCHYTTDFGVYGTSAQFPDYDKLGDTKDFLLIGVNNYLHLQTFMGADLAWIAKPPKGKTCLADGDVVQGVKQHLLEANGDDAFTPVPSNQIDPSSTGYVVANADLNGGGLSPDAGSSSKLLDVFKITKKADGTPKIPSTAVSLNVAKYSVPPTAPQMGTSSRLDTLDGRLTSSHEAIDPTDGKRYVYTQQAVAGGAGAEEHWFKIDVGSLGSLGNIPTNKVTDPSLFVWNANVSTDRIVNGSTKAFGDAVVIGFTTSSSTTFASDQMVSKIGSGGQSAFVLVKQGAVDICGAVCRWGDYSAATPDPAADPQGNHGVVWLTNMYEKATDDGSWNWSASP